MPRMRKLAAVAGAAAIATLGVAPAANAAVLDGGSALAPLGSQQATGGSSLLPLGGGLGGMVLPTGWDAGDTANILSVVDNSVLNGNNIGPFQVCNNNVPVNVVGGQVPVSDIIGILGIGSDGNASVLVKNCVQDSHAHSHQNN